MLQNGNEFIVDGKGRFTEPSGVEAFEFVLDLHRTEYARLAGEDKYLSGPFSNGDVMMYGGSSVGVAVNPTTFKYGAAARTV
ncbi:MAG: hypothetical protein AB7C91_13600 [Sphaerochaeta sp.]|uniref:hypothetical protein n=1 Tax=Sphaerochaeta sp. TaxID=1972642 RepID=UPI003D12A1F6